MIYISIIIAVILGVLIPIYAFGAIYYGDFYKATLWEKLKAGTIIYISIFSIAFVLHQIICWILEMFY